MFISVWWDRHGPQPVGTAELFDLAATCDPALPLGEGSERSQRTKLGMIVFRLRDRVFPEGIPARAWPVIVTDTRDGTSWGC